MRFLQKALAALDTIYRFEGGLRSTDQLDLASPVSLVHGVDREAEIAASVYGVYSHSVTTGGAGAPAFTARAKEDFYPGGSQEGLFGSQLRAKGLTVTNSDLWLVRSQAKSSGVNLASAVLGVLLPNDSRFVGVAGSNSDEMQVGYGDATLGLTVAGGLAYLCLVDAANVVHPWANYTKLPLPVRELHMRTLDDAVGACTVMYSHFLAFVPAYARPHL